MVLKKLLTPDLKISSIQVKKNILRVVFREKEDGGDKELVFQLVKTFKIAVILDNLGQQNF